MRVLSDGRLRRSAEEWRTVLARFRASGQDQVKFCRAEKITLSTFRHWQSRLRGRVEVSDFVPVIQALARTEPDPGPPPPSGSAAWSLEVRLPNGVQLQFRG
ncbi:MAG: hypothetical protein IT349_20635 [Candidatus Eisenbacteria bacterium]|nr:hypothetical protein [Candidatus Eisenbacteria bacterium]